MLDKDINCLGRATAWVVRYIQNVKYVKYVENMRDKQIYIKTIGISEEDMKFIENIKNKIGGKKSKSGILSMIINSYKKI